MTDEKHHAGVDGGYVFDDSGKIVGLDPDYKPRLLDTPSFAASTLRTIADGCEQEAEWARFIDMQTVGKSRWDTWAAFLRQLADELEAQ